MTLFASTKRHIIRLLTWALPLTPLRRLYIWYYTLNNIYRYGDWKFPRIITIEISSHCNRTCSYCPNVIYPKSAKLMKADMVDLIAARLGELRYNGVVDFIFFNEPTLHPELPNIIRKIKAKAPYCIPRISTNGDILNEARVKQLIDAGLDRIYVMRHNPTPLDWRARIEYLSKEFPGVFVRMDIDECEENDGLHDFNGLVEVKKHRGRKIIDGKARCQVHRHIGQITIEGDWNLCCVDYAKTKSYGNLITKSFLDIWHSPEFVSDRKRLEAGEPVTKTCETCTCLVERKAEHRRPDFVPRPSLSEEARHAAGI